MTVAHRFAKNLLWFYSAQFLILVFGFITVVYIARVLGDTAFGQIAFAQALLNYLLLATDFGFTTQAIPLVAKDRDRTAEVTGQVVFLRLVLSLIVVAGTSASLLLVPTSASKKLVILFFALTIVPSAFDLGWVFAAHEKMESVGFLLFFRVVITFFLIIFILRFNAHAITVSIIYLIAYCFSAVLNWIWYRKNFAVPRMIFSWQQLKPFLIQALPLGLSLFMIRIYYYSDNFLLSCFHGDRVVGWYNAGYKIVHILIGLAGYYGSVFLPTVSNQSIVSAENTRNLVQHSFRLLLVFSLPMLVYGVGFAHEIITTIFGVEYINGVPPFQILLVAMVIVFAGVVFTNSLIAFDGQKTLLILVSIAAALSVGLNLLLIPQIGMTGAALTTTLAEFIVLGGGVYTLRSRINLEIILRTSLKVILAATIMALTLWSLRSINVFLAMMSSALMYIISLLVLGVLHRRDWTQLVNLIKFQLSSNAITER